MSRPADHETATLRVASLRADAPVPIRLEPDGSARAALADQLGLLALRKLRLEAEVVPDGPRGWRLQGRLGATVVQPCSVTGAPVTTRIDTDVLRRFLPDLETPDPGSETEMPQDDSAEPLGEVIDPAAVMAEALALALPDYPRAEGAELGNAVFAAPGVAPMTDAAASPFAALKALRDGTGDDT